MRVIAGSFKGRRLVTPTWGGLRPTSDKLRETLFNVVAARVPGACVLDGFAGTGAFGIEAVSRGAAHVTFVDRDRRATALVAENLDRCRVEGGYAIIAAAFRAALRGPLAAGEFDLIFLDPPYDEEGLDEVLAAAGNHLADQGLLDPRACQAAAGPGDGRPSASDPDACVWRQYGRVLSVGREAESGF